MPGILHSQHQPGFRIVAKMEYDIFQPDLNSNNWFADPDVFESIFSSKESGDSDSDLPDHEHPVDLIKFLDSPHLDPFLWSPDRSDGQARPGPSKLCLEQLASYDSEGEQKHKVRDTKIFSAWNTPKTEEDTEFVVPKNWHGVADDSSYPSFPDTPSPSAQSDHNTGDDSDVDIETITETPRYADSCSYLTHESSPTVSSASSPWSLSRSSSQTSDSVDGTSCTGVSLLRISNVVSLSGCSTAKLTSLLTQKRRLSKEKKHTSKTQPSYTPVLCSSSINFHDYAMSPSACIPDPCTETGRPTVLSKRMYRRHAVADAADKDKQHHHNQLERNRRQKLADLFVDLRDEVPQLSCQTKASKVLILKEAATYIRDLQKLSRQQEGDIARELRRKEALKKQMKHLQAQKSTSVR